MNYAKIFETIKNLPRYLKKTKQKVETLKKTFICFIFVQEKMKTLKWMLELDNLSENLATSFE